MAGKSELEYFKSKNHHIRIPYESDGLMKAYLKHIDRELANGLEPTVFDYREHLPNRNTKKINTSKIYTEKPEELLEITTLIQNEDCSEHFMKLDKDNIRLLRPRDIIGIYDKTHQQIPDYVLNPLDGKFLEVVRHDKSNNCFQCDVWDKTGVRIHQSINIQPEFILKKNELEKNKWYFFKILDSHPSYDKLRELLNL